MATPSYPDLPASGRSRRLILLMASMLGVLAVLGWMWFRPKPVPGPYFLPLWITEYQNTVIPSFPMGERDQLLVLDIFNPPGLPRPENHDQDIASALAVELDGVPDPRRLVLSACSPGQVALVSDELGRSVFSYYLEEGLRGYAAGYSAEG